MPLPGNNQRLPKDDITVFLPVQAGETRLTPFRTFAQPETVCPEALQKNAFPQTGKPYGEAFSFFQESF